MAGVRTIEEDNTFTGGNGTMSNLSQSEVTAGISRKALETLQRRNGHEKTTKVVIPANGPGVRTDPPVPERVSVLQTWCHDLDLVNIDGWNFQVRDTQHLSGHNPIAIYLHLNRAELEMLEKRIHQVLAETP